MAAAALGTNYIAHDSLRPPYMHRSQTDPADNWYDYTYVRDGKVRDSYWRDPVGIDQGEPSLARLCAARHGRPSRHLFAHAGLAAERRGAWRCCGGSDRSCELALLIAMLSLVCLAFYLSRPQIDRNYGGMTSGFRWMFWFAPLWLVALLPAADRLAASRAGPRPGAGAAGAVGHVGQLSHLESLDASLADQLDAVLGGCVLTLSPESS